MIDQLIRMGDEVVIVVDKTTRGLGCNPSCPNGTGARVLGFSEMPYGRTNTYGREPGVYVNRAFADLGLGDGRKLEMMQSGHFRLADAAEYRRRLAELRKLQRQDPDSWWSPKEFLRKLPKTPFWEGDYVRVPYGRIEDMCGGQPSDLGPDVVQVTRIDYGDLARLTDAGTKYPAYQVSSRLINARWSVSACEDEMTLVKRGPIWQFYHGEPIAFRDVVEEASFFYLLGRFVEVRNPRSGLYEWAQQEVIDAIQSGIVDSCASGGRMFGTGFGMRVLRFTDTDLRPRIARATLAKFAVAPI